MFDEVKALIAGLEDEAQAAHRMGRAACLADRP